LDVVTGIGDPANRVAIGKNAAANDRGYRAAIANNVVLFIVIGS
jgi:hypothetical protein